MKQALLPCKLPDPNETKTAQNTPRRPVQGAPLWIPAFAGMTKKDHSPRSYGFPSFSQNAPCHSREGGNPLGITVIHFGVLFLNQPNLPCQGPFFQVHLFCAIRAFNRTTFYPLIGCISIGSILPGGRRAVYWVRLNSKSQTPCPNRWPRFSNLVRGRKSGLGEKPPLSAAMFLKPSVELITSSICSA